jgi:hypothetical protein
MARNNSVVKPENNVEAGDCTFPITFPNEVMLKALSKYAMMLDYVTNAKDDEKLNIDGLINSILYEGMTKRIKDLVKKHGFEDSQEFIDCMAACKDGEEVSVEVKNQEKVFYQTAHDEILAHIPMEDRQKALPFNSTKNEEV